MSLSMKTTAADRATLILQAMANKINTDLAEKVVSDLNLAESRYQKELQARLALEKELQEMRDNGCPRCKTRWRIHKQQKGLLLSVP